MVFIRYLIRGRMPGAGLDGKKGHVQLDKYYEWSAARIERQDGLINQRLTWLLTSQGLLFAAFGLSFTVEFEYAKVLEALREVLIVVGFGIGLLALSGVLGALIAMRQIHDDLTEQCSRQGVCKTSYPKMMGCRWSAGLGLAPAWVLPIVFCIAWVYIYFNRIC